MNPERAILPKGLSRLSLLRTPKRHREDAYQEAWLAFLQGRDPATAVRSYVGRESRYEGRVTLFSQLDGEDRPKGDEQ